ncbi:MAG: Fe-S-containing hydro-lyase [Erysipelotrichaceae bacterium]|nr:Fe-S-containing hydro-lyase [Erysipelotrichaceae bacterium]
MKRLYLPLCEEERTSLKAGEAVLLNGEIYTARDAAHKKMHEAIAKGEELPFDIHDAVIYYVGPTPAREGQAIGSAGPTTAGRMDPYTPQLIELGLRGMIGKGRRSQAVKDAIVRNRAVDFVAVGGAGALLSHSISAREPVAYEELLAEAVTKLTVKDFPCFVGIDCEGNDIYDSDECVPGRQEL